MTLTLRPHPTLHRPAGPVVLVIMDGVGVGAGDEADAVALARTPTLDGLRQAGRFRTLRAHGRAVGLPSDDDMGNSEVGHNALGAGVVHAQGALLVGRALASGALLAGAPWQAVISRGVAGGTVHFLGLLSDGNVHAHQDHLHALLRAAAHAGCRRLRVHVLLDGRDVAPTSALVYVDRLELVLAELRGAGVDAQIASGGGRQLVTMDRYDADWRIVERGWRAHVHGDAPRFASATAAILAARDATPAIIDQDLPAFVVADGNGPVGPIVDGDAVVMTNFRGDRAIEITRAFEDDALTAFDRGRRPAVLYVGMMQYDGDAHLPHRFLVAPPTIADTFGERLAHAGVTQLAIAETQKYGHVTYFWNGNRSDMFDPTRETYVEIPSDRVPFEQRPWMRAAEVTDRLIDELRTGRHQFARVNYANGDMVGHTGSLDATVLAVETVDLQLARLLAAIDALGGVAVITADHGNADEMFQHDKAGRVSRDPRTGAPVIKTSHSLAPVPLYLHGGAGLGLTSAHPEAGIASVAATCIELLGYAAPEDLTPSLLTTGTHAPGALG